ncbi:MAG: hypothetical protein GY943_35035, partial [Chloroflexi bacterium]|nr:hypothetical protein [Chloroflexota bacterium]
MSQLRKKTSFLLRQTALHRMVMQHHPDIGQLYVPNINARIPNELGGYYIRTNKQGFRSHVDFYPEKGEKPRILFFGDSFTAGFGVDNQQRFSDLIGKELDAEVFNFGLTGSGTDQQLLIYEKFAKEIEADLIVFGVMVENIERNLNSHHRTIDRYTGEYVYTPKPYFKLVNGQLVRYHNPVPTTRLSDEPDTMGTAKREVNSTRHRLLNGLRELYYHPKFEFIRGDRRPSILQNDLVSRFLQVAQFQPYPDYLSPDTPGWQLLAALLRRFREQVSPDIPMLVVPIPDSFFYRTMPAAPIYQDRFQSLHDPEHGMFIADVTTAINQLSSEEKAQVPFKHDFHFSPYGNRLMAK